MIRKFSLLTAACAALFALATGAQAQQIYGEYVETRSADVYTGPCFANSEVGLVGDQAILAWRVQKGSWEGVRLDGLSVVGVAKASSTLGDPYSNPYPAKAVLILDERATPEQRAALQSFARSMAGELFKDVVRTETSPISLEMEYHGEHPAAARLEAGTLAGIRTRLLSERDHLCGNETAQYAPLAPTAHSMPAVALLDEFKGEGLGSSWTNRDKRSAYVGHFAR
ncbi:MAG TPA: DUF1326 domain-containing protein [Blastocatellia bacterium]|jgi:hypothetical protein|nr:DUF1326 domain-containing protein [Blastocatellia bacterium]